MDSNVNFQRPSGFTLVEMLVVMAIMVILFALVIPAVTNVITTRRLTVGAEQVMAEINFWRQSSSTRNTVMELCFIKKTQPGALSAAPLFCGVRTRLRKNDGTAQWISKTTWLPTSIVMSPSAALSNILAKAPLESSAPPEEAYTYVALSIRPSGGLDPVGTLQLNEPWFVTIINERDLGKEASALKDFVTIQIEPGNGRASTYRPH